MLSPICADSGVVSLVRLDAPILKGCGQDIFMPIYQRSILEQNFLQKFDFNSYSASKSDCFDEYGGDNSASYTLKLEHKTDEEKYVHLHFWPFYESFPQPMAQVALNPDYSAMPAWEASLPHSWFEKLFTEFLGKWEKSHGTQWGRNQHSVFQVDFDEDQIRIRFDLHHGEFDLDQNVELGCKASVSNLTSAMYKTKDWILAMRAVSVLPVDGDVSILANSDVFTLRFKTSGESGAEHEIHIPTIDEKHNRCTAAYMKYEPQLVADEELGEVEPEDNDPELLAASWPEAGGAK
jgi:hypothetical protein